MPAGPFSAASIAMPPIQPSVMVCAGYFEPACLAAASISFWIGRSSWNNAFELTTKNLPSFSRTSSAFGLEMAPGDIVVAPAELAQRFERAHLCHPGRPGIDPVRPGILELGRERRVVGGRRRDHLFVDRRHAHLLRQFHGVIHFAARERNGHGGKADLHRAFRRRLDEVERRLTVVMRGIAGGAELQRIGRRIDALRADAAREQAAARRRSWSRRSPAHRSTTGWH